MTVIKYNQLFYQDNWNAFLKCIYVILKSQELIKLKIVCSVFNLVWKCNNLIIIKKYKVK